MTHTWLKYVPHAQVGDWQRVGWYRLSDLDACYHGEYASLMEWRGAGDPVCPPKARERTDAKVVDIDTGAPYGNRSSGGGAKGPAKG